MAHVLQRTLDPRVATETVLGRHPDDQPSNLDEHRGSSGPLPSAGPFCGNQLAVPAENGVRRDDGRHVAQRAASESLPKHREPSTLVIVRPQPPAAQPCLQRAVPFVEKGNHVALLALEPSQQRRQQHLRIARKWHETRLLSSPTVSSAGRSKGGHLREVGTGLQVLSASRRRAFNSHVAAAGGHACASLVAWQVENRGLVPGQRADAVGGGPFRPIERSPA